ncbi:MAG: polysaccharide deacetylase family protein [Dysgonamonadaceae bacterium]|nr:polysaccharide deacetylase family protein [Dysgonamonadaceae bacterium]
MKIYYNFLLITLSFVLFAGCTQPKQNSEKEKSQVTKTENDISISMESIIEEPVENSVTEILQKKEIPVLCYHRIEDGRNDVYTVSPDVFASHLNVLSDSGYNAILPDELYHYLKYNAALPPNPFMITFDDSRTEHFNIAAPELEKRGFKGVFFIMTVTNNKKNYLSTGEITQLANNGHTVGLHSWDHVMVTKYTDSTFWKQQVFDPRKKLENMIEKSVDYWAYPNGVYDREAAKELDKHFKLSFILMAKRDSLYPLQTIRRMITPPVSPDRLIKLMRSNFN